MVIRTTVAGAVPSATCDRRVGCDEYAPEWVDARLTSRGEPLRPRVRDLYSTQLRLHTLPVLGPTRLAKITTPTVRHGYSAPRGPDGPSARQVAAPAPIEVVVDPVA
jgi:hypothetical protein